MHVYEGAPHNLPDERAMLAATCILEAAQGATPDNVVLVLVSGGGSALLPLPAPGITLADKLSVVRQLAASGASIDVRRHTLFALQ